MATPVLKDLVAQYRAERLSFFPLPFRAKRDDSFKWGQFQDRLPTDDEIGQWFNGHPSNIAVVCGQVSGGLVVVEFDNEDFFAEFNVAFKNRTHIPITEFTRVTKGKRGPHVWLRVKGTVKSKKTPKCEIRSDGNYIVVPPSVHPEGPTYQFLNDLPIREIESLIEVGINIEQQPVGNNQPGWVSQLLMGVGKGGRNDAAVKLAGYFRNILPIDVTERVLLDWNNHNSPPLEPGEVLRTVASVYRYPDRSVVAPMDNVTNPRVRMIESDRFQTEYEPDKNQTDNQTNARQKPPILAKPDSPPVPLSDRVEEWVKTTSGWFDTPELDRDLGISSQADKANRQKVMSRLKDKGVIEHHPKISKQFRFVNTAVTSLAFKTAKTDGVLPLLWPLKIEQFVNIFPGNIIVVAGSPNSGKTAFMLEFIHKNQKTMPIYYFCSEMGEVELKDRLLKFPDMKIEDWCFEAIERASDFADVIRPDCVNVIDFLEMTTELYLVNQHLTAIHHKLGASGVAIIAIQKKVGAAFGRGLEFGLEKPKLYLSMDKGKIQIIKGKSWAKKNVDPNGLQAKFKVLNGCQLQPLGKWDWPNSGGIEE
jgi:hypothetical protein